MTNIGLLHSISDKLTSSFALMDSKWCNYITEVIAAQCIRSCSNNHRKYGDAFSWATENMLKGENRCGLSNLTRDGSIVRELYEGDRKHPKTTQIEDGKPVILRVTNEMLEYVESLLSKGDEQ